MNEYDMNSIDFLRFIKKKHTSDNKLIGELAFVIFGYLKTTDGISEPTKVTSNECCFFRKKTYENNIVTSEMLFQFFKGRKSVTINDITDQFPSLSNHLNDSYSKVVHHRIAHLKEKNLISSTVNGVYDFADELTLTF